MFFGTHNLFAQQNRGVRNTTVDYYSDCVLLNIIANQDSENPVLSIIIDNYMLDDKGQAVDCLFNSVETSDNANQSYGRYWHGSITYLKPLLCFFNITQIYLLLQIIVWIQLIGVSSFFIIKKETRILVSLLIAFFMVKGYMGGTCVQFFNSISIMMLGCVFFYFMYQKGLPFVYLASMILGMLTCYFDFLTSETMTITVPLLCILCSKTNIKNNDLKFKNVVQTLGIWGIGYSTMFCMKWFLLLLINGRESLFDSVNRVEDYSKGNILEAIYENFKMLWSLNDEIFDRFHYLIIGLFVIFAVFCIILLFHKINLYFLATLLFVGMVPYFRYMVLSKHSYIHCFFTYRAQIAFLFVIMFGFTYIFQIKREKFKK